MTAELGHYALVLALAVAMCVAAALLAVRKVSLAAPADLF